MPPSGGEICMLGYLSLNIICSSKLIVLYTLGKLFASPERCPQKNIEHINVPNGSHGLSMSFVTVRQALIPRSVPIFATYCDDDYECVVWCFGWGGKLFKSVFHTQMSTFAIIRIYFFIASRLKLFWRFYFLSRKCFWIRHMCS